MVASYTGPVGRRPGETWPVRLTVDSGPYHAGSALVEQGGTSVLCNGSIEDEVPPWVAGRGAGRLTAELDLYGAMDADGNLVEVQGTAERTPFSGAAQDRMLDLATQGIALLIERQREALR